MVVAVVVATGFVPKLNGLAVDDDAGIVIVGVPVVADAPPFIKI